jgi:hypothetical protein
MSNFGDFMNTLHLHRVPFLTVDILNLVVPNMRNLTVLGIYKCPLIHIGDTIPLLDIVKLDRPIEREEQVYLDFFPNYHVGLKPFPGCTYFTGSYGVTWDNWNGDTRLAIWALVRRILPKALAQGINMSKPGTAFRGWLDRSPCWRVEETLQDLMDPKIDPIKFAVSIDYPHYHGNVSRFTGKVANRPEGWEWWVDLHSLILARLTESRAVKSYTCKTCKTILPGIFYAYTQIRQAKYLNLLDSPRPSVRCLGCTLTASLYAEDDHYKLLKRRIIRKWLEDEDGLNTNELQRALVEFDEKDIMQDVQALDELRFAHMHTGPADDRFDREYADRQRELTRAELGRLGLKNMAPHIDDEQRWLERQNMSAEDRHWSSICKDRLWGHGHGTA